MMLPLPMSDFISVQTITHSGNIAANPADRRREPRRPAAGKVQLKFESEPPGEVELDLVDVSDLARKHFAAFDAIVCLGVLHHLNDDEVLGVLRSARNLLKPSGRFVSYDPCFIEPQHRVARWIHRHDRGNFVRFDRQYEDLIARVFRTYRREVRTDMCTVPATVVVFDCDAPAASGFQGV